MRLLRTFALSAALLGSASLVLAQDYHAWQYQGHDDRDYRAGYDQGRADAMSGRRPHPSSDRREFRDGYDAGYNSVRNGGREGYPRDGGYGPGGGAPGLYGNSSRVAEQNGYRDGVNDGQKDRSTGHSFRPTQDNNYKNAPGYTSSMGDHQEYKNVYRQGYERGYQEGYNGGYRR